MKQVMIALAFVGLIGQAIAQDYVSSEDRSRFVEAPYKKALPGMLAPSAYVEIAKKAIHQASNTLHLRTFSDPLVSHRIYQDAPKADRDIVAVQFVYEGALSGGGTIGRGFIYMREAPPVPVVQALIRKDSSKVYLNIIKYKHT